MPKKYNLIGQKFNKLTVLKKVESKNGKLNKYKGDVRCKVQQISKNPCTT